MALDRYQFTKKDAQSKWLVSRLPDIPIQASDRFIYSREGDRLDSLANEFYNEPRYWWVIAEANPGLGHGTLSVSPGRQLRIPFPIGNLLDLLQDAERSK
jgi:phage tail protein X